MSLPTSIFMVWLLVLSAPSLAATEANEQEQLTIGYLELRTDLRYDKRRMRAEFPMQPLGRPYAGAEVALKESRFTGASLGITFSLERIRAKDSADLLARTRTLAAAGVRFLLADLPAAELAALATATRDLDILIFNISARENVLRQQQCQTGLLHIIPSHAMLFDALAQHLVAHKWKEVLVLGGPEPDDQKLLEAFDRSARRMGLDIVARRSFVLSNDPRERDRNNIALLTGGEDYDVVLVADSYGEFSRDLPFKTMLPRPVVGSAGLSPAAWSWAWERHGAPQLNKRFEKHAKRRMGSVDWAAWMSFKSIVEAVLRTGVGEFNAVRNYLLSDKIVLDGFKGNRLAFRPWNNQLRQPVLLTTLNWVVARAPLQGFLHASNNMDTLGFDQPESLCEAADR